MTRSSTPRACCVPALIARLARGRRHGYDADSIRERAAASLYDVKHAVARELHAIARNRLLTALALGYVPDGAPDFGLDRGRLAGAAAPPYGILLHATARPRKEWPESHWIALGRALGAQLAGAAMGNEGRAGAQRAHRRGADGCRACPAASRSMRWRGSSPERPS